MTASLLVTSTARDPVEVCKFSLIRSSPRAFRDRAALRMFHGQHERSLGAKQQ